MSQEMKPSEGLRAVLDLYGVAESMVRQSFLRENPTATDSEIENQVRRWLSLSLGRGEQPGSSGPSGSG